MTIREKIQKAITTIQGNKPFTLAEIDTFYNGNGDVERLERDQIGDALRSLSNVKRVGRGRYVVKGRRVFP